MRSADLTELCPPGSRLVVDDWLAIATAERIASEPK